MPEHELESFNFAHFLGNILNNHHIIKSAPAFEKFCLQTLKNNHLLLFNRYYVGNGGSPAYELISTFLISNY